MGPLKLTALLAALSAVESSAIADWTATRLHSVGAVTSEGHAVSATAVAGHQWFGGPTQATVWNQSGPVNISPNVSAYIRAMDGQSYAGGMFPGHAALWPQAGAPVVNLHPGGSYTKSEVWAARNGMQAGVAQIGFANRAVMWTGTAQSFVDLTPSWAEQARAVATDGMRQGGEAYLHGGGWHAILWNSSPDDYIDLNPGGAYGNSAIRGMVLGQQVGYVSSPGGDRAALWSGSAESFVNMHPFPGFGASKLYATTGSIQVGSSNVPGFSIARAGMWFGTAESFVDLHAFLPLHYNASFAYAVHEENGFIRIAGAALNTQTAWYEAWLWEGTVPAPGTAVVLGLWGVLACQRRRG